MDAELLTTDSVEPEQGAVVADRAEEPWYKAHYLALKQGITDLDQKHYGTKIYLFGEKIFPVVVDYEDNIAVSAAGLLGTVGI